MFATLLSVIPIFGLVMTGFIAKRFLPSHDLWKGIEALVYYLFFPILLILEISKANFSEPGLIEALLATFFATLLIALLLFPIKQLFKIENRLFTSIFQGGTRYNSYVFLALSQSLFGSPGIIIAGVFMAYMIITINILCISVLNLYGSNQSGKKSLGGILLALLKNPLIIGVLIGIAANLLQIELSGPFKQWMLYLGNSATPLSLMSVGAGLIIMMDAGKMKAITFAIALKLLLMPAITIFLLKMLGVEGITAGIALLFATMPSAGNAYILSRQMGGDSDAMASIITWSTLLSIITIPLIMSVVS
ncbi:AEC family transporter [Ignatzschineria indica]|uniref:AEC family transporter n=1 Tax=Ignatzschineria indica TaxID=472583 RepID=UPI002577B2E4|nr:AEC family transporter [Ignatzschineria indica]MDM1545828.1 AEC family transporter [Ignatzschineria indica]